MWLICVLWFLGLVLTRHSLFSLELYITIKHKPELRLGVLWPVWHQHFCQCSNTLCSFATLKKVNMSAIFVSPFIVVATCHWKCCIAAWQANSWPHLHEDYNTGSHWDFYHLLNRKSWGGTSKLKTHDLMSGILLLFYVWWSWRQVLCSISWLALRRKHSARSSCAFPSNLSFPCSLLKTENIKCRA